MEKRKPMLRRKGAPSVIIALGGPSKEAPEQESADETLTCPKCGMELADTEENRAYAAEREKEVPEESDDEMDEDDEA